MIDNKLLEYLIVFYKEGSLLKASEVLHLSEPSLSKAMKSLEDEIGLKIFDRKKNKLSLNEGMLYENAIAQMLVANKLLPFINEVINSDRILVKKAQEIKEKRNKISIGYTAPGIFYKYSDIFMNKIIKVEISTILDEEDNLIKDIANDKYDVIFINKEIKNDGFVCRKIFQEHLYISIPPTHFLSGMKNGVYWKDIDGQSFLLFSYVGVWSSILEKNLFKAHYIKNADKNDLEELTAYSSIPAFVTDISSKFKSTANRINIPILDEDAKLNFYIVYKKNNYKVQELFEN